MPTLNARPGRVPERRVADREVESVAELGGQLEHVGAYPERLRQYPAANSDVLRIALDTHDLNRWRGHEAGHDLASGRPRQRTNPRTQIDHPTRARSMQRKILCQIQRCEECPRQRGDCRAVLRLLPMPQDELLLIAGQRAVEMSQCARLGVQPGVLLGRFGHEILPVLSGSDVDGGAAVGVRGGSAPWRGRARSAREWPLGTSTVAVARHEDPAHRVVDGDLVQRTGVGRRVTTRTCRCMAGGWAAGPHPTQKDSRGPLAFHSCVRAGKEPDVLTERRGPPLGRRSLRPNVHRCSGPLPNGRSSTLMFRSTTRKRVKVQLGNSPHVARAVIGTPGRVEFQPDGLAVTAVESAWI